MERALVPFTIPLAGSKQGVTDYAYGLGEEFFACFPESPVQQGDISVRLSLDKRPDMFQLHVELEGRVASVCDRCTAEIRLPIEGDYDLILKFGEGFDEDDEVVVLPVETAEFNVAQFLYECVVLSIPVRRVYDCILEEPRPCDRAVLDYLERESERPAGTEPPADNPFGTLLDKLNKN
jgi:uncharacterized metal-binding protein YceD (DUF177 family)